MVPNSRVQRLHRVASLTLSALSSPPLVPHTPADRQPPALATLPSKCLGPLPLVQPSTMEEVDRLSAVREIWRRHCDILEPWQQEELWQVLSEFKDIFALTDSDVGLTHLVQHEIDTGDAQPIKTRPRRLPMAHRGAADSAIEEMLETGIIEPSDSPWASGVVMVSKKRSHKMRFCVD